MENILENDPLTIPNSFIALKTSFIISCGFDCERIPKCHFAFFSAVAFAPVFERGGVVETGAVELDGFRL